MSKVSYRYMRANLETLTLLYDDALYFSTPDLFNDPFDSNPTLELDVDTEILDKIYRELLISRIISDGTSNSSDEIWCEFDDALEKTKQKGRQKETPTQTIKQSTF